jgi:hypothetical protein
MLKSISLLTPGQRFFFVIFFLLLFFACWMSAVMSPSIVQAKINAAIAFVSLMLMCIFAR